MVKKSSKKKVVSKPNKTKEVKAKAPAKNLSKKVEKKQPKNRCFVKLLLTVIISAVVAVSIVITTPLWMDKLLPAEKQPAFLRKALMPVTNIKVIRTEPLPNDVEKLIIETDKKLSAKVDEIADKYDEEISKMKKKVANVDDKSRYIDYNWKNKSMQYKMFLVSFYNMHSKALSGVNYANEIDMMKLNLEPQMLIHKDLPWIEAYKNKPPASLKAIGRKVDKNYSNIIIQRLKEDGAGLKAKFFIALNGMFKLEKPADKLKEGSLKHNLAQFISATKRNNACKAMNYGALIAKQSPWFKDTVLNELEARVKINKQLVLVKQRVEEEIYRDEIENMIENKKLDSKTRGRYYQKLETKERG